MLVAFYGSDFYPYSDTFLKKPSDTHRLIICDGKILFITQNLYDGLRSVCSSSEGATNYWWIDQLCINQVDGAEKSMQIPLMGQIYRQSSHVAVWLGHGSSWEVKSLRHLLNLHGRGPCRYDRTYWGWHVDAARAVLALASVTRRFWFRRVWIVQEMALARKLTFFLGKHSIPYDNFYQSIDLLCADPSCMGSNMIFLRSLELRKIRTLLASRQTFQNGGSWTIKQWITAIRGHKARDLHDYIYAGLSLLSDSDKFVVSVDYSKTTDELFRNVTEHLLSSKLGVNTLSLAERGSEHYHSPSRPTWQINVNSVTERTPMLELGQGRYLASPRSGETSYTIQGGFLHTQALLVDHVDVVCPESLIDMGTGIEDLVAIMLRMSRMYKWTEEDALVAIARTITADIWPPDDPICRDIQQTVVTFIGTMAELSIRTRKQKSTEVSPSSPFTELQSCYHHYDWTRDWAAEKSRNRSRNLKPGRLTRVSLPSVELSQRIKAATAGRRLFMTAKGMIGLGPATMEKGQTIAILAGGHVPFLFHSISLPLDVKNVSDLDKALVARARLLHQDKPAMQHLEMGAQDYGRRCMAVDEAVDEERGGTPGNGTYRESPGYHRGKHEERFCLNNLPREAGLFSSMRLVGETYLHGFMYGEVEKLVQQGVVSWQSIEIQ